VRVNQRGETLVEVVMALGILSLVLVSSYALATGTFRLGRGAGERTQAVNYLQEQAEALRVYRNSVDWNPTFMNAMASYNPALDKTFCMHQEAGKWVPTETDCLRGNIKIAITAQPVNVGTIVNQQYEFKLVATWKTAAVENNVSLTTKLANQGYTP